MNRPDTSAY